MQTTTVASQAAFASDTSRILLCVSPERVLDELVAEQDVRDGVVLGPDGELLAGADALAAPTRELLSRAGDAAEIEIATHGGVVYAARSQQGAIAVVTGRSVLPAVMR